MSEFNWWHIIEYPSHPKVKGRCSSWGVIPRETVWLALGPGFLLKSELFYPVGSQSPWTQRLLLGPPWEAKGDVQLTLLVLTVKGGIELPPSEPTNLVQPLLRVEGQTSGPWPSCPPTSVTISGSRGLSRGSTKNKTEEAPFIVPQWFEGLINQPWASPWYNVKCSFLELKWFATASIWYKPAWGPGKSD